MSISASVTTKLFVSSANYFITTFWTKFAPALLGLPDPNDALSDLWCGAGR